MKTLSELHELQKQYDEYHEDFREELKELTKPILNGKWRIYFNQYIKQIVLFSADENKNSPREEQVVAFNDGKPNLVYDEETNLLILKIDNAIKHLL